MNKKEFRAKVDHVDAVEDFLSDFTDELAKELANKALENKKLYVDKIDRNSYCKRDPDYIAPKAYTIENDDSLQRKLWADCLKECAYYMDQPTAEEKLWTRKRLQFRHDSLFPAGWIAPLSNRTDLLTWACQ